MNDVIRRIPNGQKNHQRKIFLLFRDDDVVIIIFYRDGPEDPIYKIVLPPTEFSPWWGRFAQNHRLIVYRYFKNNREKTVFRTLFQENVCLTGTRRVQMVLRPASGPGRVPAEEQWVALYRAAWGHVSTPGCVRCWNQGLYRGTGPLGRVTHGSIRTLLEEVLRPKAFNAGRRGCCRRAWSIPETRRLGLQSLST